MLYPIVGIVLLIVFIPVAYILYAEHVDRQNDRAEELRFRAMSTAERQEALDAARRELVQAHRYLDDMYRLWRGYKWGYRHNPYFGRYTVARREHSRAHARVARFEGIIAETAGE